MQDKPTRPQGQADMEQLIRTHAQMLYRVCLVMLCNRHDAEDAVQETFLRYITKGPDTADEEYRKAWLLRTATNLCKNLRLFQRRHSQQEVAALGELGVSPQHGDTFRELMQLPAKQRVVLLLYYVHGYRTGEIAQMLRLSPAAVRKRLQLGRERLRLELRKE